VQCSKVDEAASFGKEHWTRELEQPFGVCCGHIRECALKLAGTARLNELRLHAQRRCCFLHPLEHLICRLFAECIRMPEYGDARHCGKQFLEKSETLGDQFWAKKRRSGNISPGSREARHESILNRIAHRSRDNRDCGGCLLRGTAAGRPPGDDDIDFEVDQFGSESRKPIDLSIGTSRLDDDIPTFDIAELGEPPTKGIQVCSPFGRFKTSYQHNTYSSDRGLLRARRERPRNRAAEQRDELATLHSITSSARASSKSGNVMPSAFAALRLMRNSIFVACWTGRFAGFSPLRIRPT
jgi:hypothetical protein